MTNQQADSLELQKAKALSQRLDFPVVGCEVLLHLWKHQGEKVGWLCHTHHYIDTTFRKYLKLAQEKGWAYCTPAKNGAGREWWLDEETTKVIFNLKKGKRE